MRAMAMLRAPPPPVGAEWFAEALVQDKDSAKSQLTPTPHHGTLSEKDNVILNWESMIHTIWWEFQLFVM